MKVNAERPTLNVAAPLGTIVAEGAARLALSVERSAK